MSLYLVKAPLPLELVYSLILQGLLLPGISGWGFSIPEIEFIAFGRMVGRLVGTLGG